MFSKCFHIVVPAAPAKQRRFPRPIIVNPRFPKGREKIVPSIDKGRGPRPFTPSTDRGGRYWCHPNRAGHGRSGNAAGSSVQGSKIEAPEARTSFTFRVARYKSLSIAVAASSVSITGGALPAAR